MTKLLFGCFLFDHVHFCVSPRVKLWPRAYTEMCTPLLWTLSPWPRVMRNTRDCLNQLTQTEHLYWVTGRTIHTVLTVASCLRRAAAHNSGLWEHTHTHTRLIFLLFFFSFQPLVKKKNALYRIMTKLWTLSKWDQTRRCNIFAGGLCLCCRRGDPCGWWCQQPYLSQILHCWHKHPVPDVHSPAQYHSWGKLTDLFMCMLMHDVASAWSMFVWVGPLLYLCYLYIYICTHTHSIYCKCIHVSIHPSIYLC